MMISFHLPPTAASAAVSGQSLTGFGFRVRQVVTPRFLLVATMSITLRFPYGSHFSMVRGARVAAAGRARAAGRSARLRFRDRLVDGAAVAARSSPDRLDDVARVRGHFRRPQSLGRPREPRRARREGRGGTHRGSDAPA